MTRDDVMVLAARGNVQALEFLRCVYAVADLADDLHDQDKELPSNATYRLVRELLHLTMLPYYTARAPAFAVLLSLGLLQWHVANNDPKADSAAINNVLFAVAIFEGGMDLAEATIRMLHQVPGKLTGVQHGNMGG